MNRILVLSALVAISMADMSIEDKKVENAMFAMVGEDIPHDIPVDHSNPGLHDKLVAKAKNITLDAKPITQRADHKGHEHHIGEHEDHSAHGAHEDHNAHGAHEDHNAHGAHEDHNAHGAHEHHNSHGAHENQNAHGAHENHNAHGAHEDHSAHGAHEDHSAHGAHEDQNAHGAHEDHSAHGAHMMMMWFHGGCNEVILFDFWRIESCCGLVISCGIIFVMGALYEGLKWFRVYLTLFKTNTVKRDTLPVVAQNQPLVNATSRSTTPEASRPGPFSLMRNVQALLYIVQLVLAYWLMLIVMTYNTWLTIAVILGAGFGHWLFAALRFANPSGEAADCIATDACH